jgi:branched-chain amino acid transport system ATP-binding protein
MPDTVLTVSGLAAGYGRMLAVEDIHLEVSSGEVWTLLGANGAGKTTLLRTIAGSLRAHAGSVRFQGTEVTAWAPHRMMRSGVVLCPQERDLFPTLTVEENLRVGAHVHRRRRAWTEEQLLFCLSLFPPLERLLSRPAGGLSGGEQQMAAMARSLMSDPKLLLLDEPSAGLAPLIVESIFDSIRVLTERGLTIVLAEQNAREALSVADHVAVLSSGRVVTSGEASRFNSDDEIIAGYFGGALSADASPPAETE